MKATLVLSFKWWGFYLTSSFIYGILAGLVLLPLEIPQNALYNALLMEELASSLSIKCSQQHILNQNLSFSCNKRLEEHFESFCHNSINHRVR